MNLKAVQSKTGTARRYIEQDRALSPTLAGKLVAISFQRHPAAGLSGLNKSR